MSISILKNPARWLCTTGLVGLISIGFSMQAVAQFQDHGVGVGKSCPLATKVGDLALCEMEVRNEDDFGDTIEVLEFWDVVDPGGSLEFRNPATGNLPIIAVSDGVTCASDAGEPIGLSFPCSLNGEVDGSGEFVRVRSEYIVPDGAEDPLLDQANVIVQDACDVQSQGCNPDPQRQQFGAAVSLFEPAISVTKIGDPTAKVGDDISYTIGFTNESGGTGFPGFENCTGNDDVFGDLGSFDAGVTRDFTFPVPDVSSPLVNTATITCDVVGFDNTVSNNDSHSAELIDPAIALTKTGPATAKVGDAFDYTISFENTGSGAVENCTVNDPLLGG
ncbi:MAG: hypothetical protein KGY53_09245, partial [Wenzhouxiangellaceae bacterium]|nr:hypothetical protein [Wenzhouxiangellaceae bacterium]